MQNWREPDIDVKKSTKIRSEDDRTRPSNLPVPVESKEIAQPGKLVEITSEASASSLFKQAKSYLKDSDRGHSQSNATDELLAGGLVVLLTLGPLMLFAIFAPILRDPHHHWNFHDLKCALQLIALGAPPLLPFLLPVFASLSDSFRKKKMYALAGFCYSIITALRRIPFPLLNLFSQLVALKQLNFYCETGDLLKADKLVNQMIADNDNRDPKSLSNLSYLAAISAAIIARLGDLNEAEAIAARAQDIHDKSMSLEDRITEAASRSTRRLAQLQLQEKRSRSVDFPYNYNMGLYFEYAGKLEESLKHFELALSEIIDGAYDLNLTVSIVTGIGSVYLKMGKLDEAESWLSLSSFYGDYNSVNAGTKEQIFNNLAALSISRGEFGAAKEYLHSAERLSRTWTKSLSRASTLSLLATLCVKDQDWEGAESYLKQTIEIRKRTLNTDDPLVAQTIREYLDVLRHLGKEEIAQNLEHDLGTAGLQATQTTAIEAPKIPPNLESIQTRATFPKRLLAWLVVATIVIGCFSIVDAGFRAAQLFDCMALIFLVITLSTISMFKLIPWLKSKSCKKQLVGLPEVSAIVSFKRLEHSEMTGGQIFVASLEAPFDRKMLVKEEFGIIRGHLYRYCQPNEFKVVCNDNKPVAVVTPDGPIAIVPWMDEAEQQLREQPKKALVWITALLVCFTLVLPISIAIAAVKSSKDTTIPAGLTSFEYYRLGVKRSANATSNAHLISARGALSKASFLDGRGMIARLAGNYAQSELPKNIPSDDVLDRYHEALDAIERGNEGAKEKLEYCLKNAPQFDWPYAILAELSIDEKNYGEAQKLLDQAKAINPQSISYLLAQAKLEEAQGNRELSYSFIKQAIENDPFKKDAYLRLAHLIFL